MIAIHSPQTKEVFTKPNCIGCPHVHDCIVIIWIKRGVQQAYEEGYR